MDKRTSTNGNKVLGYIAKRIAVHHIVAMHHQGSIII